MLVLETKWQDDHNTIQFTVTNMVKLSWKRSFLRTQKWFLGFLQKPSQIWLIPAECPPQHPGKGSNNSLCPVRLPASNLTGPGTLALIMNWSIQLKVSLSSCNNKPSASGTTLPAVPAAAQTPTSQQDCCHRSQLCQLFLCPGQAQPECTAGAGTRLSPAFL